MNPCEFIQNVRNIIRMTDINKLT